MYLNLTSDHWDSWRQSSELLCVFFSVDEIVLVLSTLPFRYLVIWKCGHKFFHIFIHPEMGCLSEWIWVSSWLRVQLLWSSMKYKVRSLKATQWLLPCSVDSLIQHVRSPISLRLPCWWNGKQEFQSALLAELAFPPSSWSHPPRLLDLTEGLQSSLCGTEETPAEFYSHSHKDMRSNMIVLSYLVLK